MVEEHEQNNSICKNTWTMHPNLWEYYGMRDHGGSRNETNCEQHTINAVNSAHAYEISVCWEWWKKQGCKQIANKSVYTEGCKKTRAVNKLQDTTCRLCIVKITSMPYGTPSFAGVTLCVLFAKTSRCAMYLFLPRSCIHFQVVPRWEQHTRKGNKTESIRGWNWNGS